MEISPNQALDLWRRSVVRSVRNDSPDFSSRQMAVLLTVYITQPPHTVRGLAAELNISKPAITRALDRLGEFGLVRRKLPRRNLDEGVGSVEPLLRRRW